MCAKIMRPTKVRASVGSSTSGSVENAIVSVPPLRADDAAGPRVCAAAPATSAQARSAAPPRTAVRALMLLMSYPLTRTGGCTRSSPGRRNRIGHSKVDPVIRQMDAIMVGSSGDGERPDRAPYHAAGPDGRPDGRAVIRRDAEAPAP